ncbi:hypothetical protein Ddye_021375 [Dipteronia dyeriana]|uniref:RNase H type-1 domain-containing protein n=1 Tax=Dipteronia dyeriana TaxID=168575 RepID=A0AAD9U2K2_9ROSI|nr:hypothetical protein Ddye_021375 [Dipteronia dyeriana]
MCNSKLESIAHAIRGYSSLRKKWVGFSLFQSVSWPNQTSFLDLMPYCFDRLLIGEMELLCINFWRVWWIRNQTIHNPSGRVDDDVVEVSCNFSPQTAKAVALLCGIRLAMEANFVPVVVESDTKVVVDMVKMGVGPAADFGNIIGDILYLIVGKPIYISFVPRVANAVAHGLAKVALSYATERVWINAYPPCLEGLI